MSNNTVPEITPGTWVVHTIYGIGRIEGETTTETGVGSFTLVSVRFEHQRLVVKFPESQFNGTVIRALSTETTAKLALAKVKKKPRPISFNHSGARAKKLVEGKIHSGQLLQLAQVVRDLFTGEEWSTVKQGYYDTARTRFVAELVLVLDRDEMSLNQEIDDALWKHAHAAA